MHQIWLLLKCIHFLFVEKSEASKPLIRKLRIDVNKSMICFQVIDYILLVFLSIVEISYFYILECFLTQAVKSLYALLEMALNITYLGKRDLYPATLFVK